MQVYNTMSLEKETFKPLHEGIINMYVCGPTVYNYIHVGNARSAIAFDTIRRYFLYRGYDVNYVSNFTDGERHEIAPSLAPFQTAKSIGSSLRAISPSSKRPAAFDSISAKSWWAKIP